jgi:hypothetical protein
VADRGDRLQLAAVAALILNGLCFVLFLCGTFAPSLFPEVMRHPPLWFWAATVGVMALLFLASRLRRS